MTRSPKFHLQQYATAQRPTGEHPAIPTHSWPKKAIEDLRFYRAYSGLLLEGLENDQAYFAGELGPEACPKGVELEEVLKGIDAALCYLKSFHLQMGGRFQSDTLDEGIYELIRAGQILMWKIKHQ